RLYRTRQSLGERLHRELQRASSRRTPRWRDLLLATRGADRHRELAASLQPRQAARGSRLQTSSTRGIRARPRRVAGCATSNGSAGHASAQANLKLTFHLDYSVGADQAIRGREASCFADDCPKLKFDRLEMRVDPFATNCFQGAEQPIAPLTIS